MSGAISLRGGRARRARHGSLSTAPLAAAPVLAAALGAIAVGAVLVRRPADGHLLIAGVIVLLLVAISLTSPQAAVVATLLGLPFLALGRRLLISYDGWHSTDPLLLIGPAVAVILLPQHYGPVAQSRLSNLVRALLALSVLESVNPLGGSLRAGVVGLLFVAGPVLWFFVGRQLANRRLVAVVMAGVVLDGAVVALYGLSQTYGGFPSWDTAWLAQGGYAALNVGGVIRPFATFSSAGEFATFLGIAISVCVATALHRRIYALALLPLLAPALFLEGSRGALVLAIATTVALVGIRTRRTVAAVVVIALVSATIIFAWHSYGSATTSAATQSSNPVVQHQLGGLAHPLSSKQSTLVAHWHLFTGGFADALRQPLGIGTSATNLAGSRYGGVTAGTEIDVSNAFVGLGILGGLIFVAIIMIVLRRALALYRVYNDLVLLVAVGALFVTLGQWLNGGYYAVAPLIWFLIGWIERASTLHAVGTSHG